MARDVTDYERGFIGALLLTPAKMADAITAGVRADWFISDGWSLMWSAFEALWKRGEISGATPISVRAEAQRLAARQKERRNADTLTPSELQRACDDATIGPLDVSIRLLRNGAIERAAKSAVAESFKSLETNADYTDGVLALRDRLDGVLKGEIDRKKIPPRAIFADIMSEYEMAHRMRVASDGPRDLKWTPGLKMPWPKMTEFLNGLRPGLHIIAARPSVGKTAFAINLMRFWCEQKYATIFCSLDMPRAEVMRRFVAEYARVSVRKASFSPTRADLDAMASAMGEMSGWPLTIVETVDVDDLRTMCMVARSTGSLDILVVDYLQLLHARALGREDAVEYARISYVSDALKRLANELHIPVVALAQLNRESTKQDQQGRLPGLADLRGSGAIEQDAFTVTILHRDSAVMDKWRGLAQTRGPDYERVTRLIPGTTENPQYRYNFNDIDPVWWILCKAQNGPTGKLPFLVRKKYFAWMLADYEATPRQVSNGLHGSTAKMLDDNSPFFERVHSDWRHDPIEEVLRLQLALIESGDEVQNMEADA